MVAGQRIDPLAFAPPAASSGPDPADPAPESAADEFGIGGPDIAAAAEAADGAQQDDAASPAPDAIDGSAVIWIDDLLSRHAP
jgi:hypothetical protein